jgi:hypothetical protein
MLFLKIACKSYDNKKTNSQGNNDRTAEGGQDRGRAGQPGHDRKNMTIRH